MVSWPGHELPPVFGKPAPGSVADLKAIEQQVKAALPRLSQAVVAVQIGGASGSGVDFELVVIEEGILVHIGRFGYGDHDAGAGKFGVIQTQLGEADLVEEQIGEGRGFMIFGTGWPSELCFSGIELERMLKNACLC